MTAPPTIGKVVLGINSHVLGKEGICSLTNRKQLKAIGSYLGLTMGVVVAFGGSIGILLGASKA